MEGYSYEGKGHYSEQGVFNPSMPGAPLNTRMILGLSFSKAYNQIFEKEILICTKSFWHLELFCKCLP